MYVKHISLDEIIKKTKLDIDSLTQIIDKRKEKKPKQIKYSKFKSLYLPFILFCDSFFF